MATVETDFGALAAQALTAKEPTMRAANRNFLIALTAQEPLAAVVSTDKLAQGPSIIREVEPEPSNLVLLTACEHLQLSESLSVRVIRTAHSLTVPLVGGLLGVAHGQVGGLLGVAHGQVGGLLGVAHGQVGTLLLRYASNERSPSSVAEPFQQLTAGRASDNLGLAKDFLKSRIREVLAAAEHEELEIGVESVFSRQVLNLLAEHGANAPEALGEILRDKLASDAVMGVLLRQLGRIQQTSSHQVRRKLLSDLLRARSVQVRHAAATGLAELDDPDAIPALELARQRERHDRPREHFELVLEQLRETRSGGSVPHR